MKIYTHRTWNGEGMASPFFVRCSCGCEEVVTAFIPEMLIVYGAFEVKGSEEEGDE